MYHFAVMVVALASIPANWQVSDTTDNATGRRHIFAETKGQEESNFPKEITAKFACSNEPPFHLTIWIETEAKFSANIVVVDLLPDMRSLKLQDIQELLKESTFTFSRYGSTLSPSNSALIDQHILKNAEKGNFRVNLYRDGGEDHISFDFSGYNILKQYMIENC